MPTKDTADASQHKLDRMVFGIYFLMLGLLLAASFLPNYRVWGLNVWAYFPTWIAVSLFAMGIAAGLVIFRLSRAFDRDTDSSHSRFKIVAPLLTVVMTASFVLGRARVHFHGDGYQLLASFSEGRVPTKAWDRGTIFIVTSLQGLLDTLVSNPVLTAYQTYSIISGILFIIIVLWSAARLFDQLTDRILFAAGLLTAGFVVLFFGYVENYALFGLMVSATSLLGVLILRKAISRWWLLVPVVLSLPLHIFSVALLPGAAFALIYDTRPARKFGRIKPRTWWLLAAALALVGLITYYVLHTNWLFFRFSTLPVVPDRFTIDNYWLFSPSHVVDMVNLLLLLVPGLPVLLAGFLVLGRRTIQSDPPLVFLSLLSVCSLGLIFLFDPKLGMPRDWDLFAFSGIPVAVLLFYAVISYRARIPRAGVLAALAIALSLLVTGPRIAGQVDAEIGLERFRYYLELDHARGRNARRLLYDYLESVGRTEEAVAERERLEVEFPERSLNDSSMAVFRQGRVREAIALCEEALRLNPTYFTAYYNLGYIYSEIGRYDTAIVMYKISDALNPYSPMTLNSIGATYLKKRNAEKGEEYLLRAIKADSTLFAPYVSLANVYIGMGRYDEAREMLNSMIAIKDAPPEVFQLVARNFLQHRQFPDARTAIRHGLQRGLDTAWVRKQMTQYPQLR